jgi:hypothetical protein
MLYRDSNEYVKSQYSSIDNNFIEFGDVIRNCKKKFLIFYAKSNVEFVRIQVNSLVHAFVQTTSFLSSVEILASAQNNNHP